MWDKEKKLILWEKDPDMLIKDAWVVLTDIQKKALQTDPEVNIS